MMGVSKRHQEPCTQHQQDHKSLISRHLIIKRILQHSLGFEAQLTASGEEQVSSGREWRDYYRTGLQCLLVTQGSAVAFLGS